MIKLNKIWIKKFVQYLLVDSVSNTYILGNYHKYGIDSKNVIFLIGIDHGKKQLKFVLMKYYGDYVFFTNELLGEKEIHLIFKKVISQEFRVISGNEFSINQLKDVFKNTSVRETSLMVLNKYVIFSNRTLYVRKLNEKDITETKRLILSIEEFEEKFKSNTDIRIRRMIVEDDSFGCFEKDRLISLVSITAKSPHSCMLTDVCVDKNYRGRGISKVVISRAIDFLRDCGIGNIALYADNPNAIETYRKIGFESIGKYLMMYNT